MRRAWVVCVIFFAAAASCFAETTLVQPGADSKWSFYDKDTEPKAGWQNLEYDEPWASGVAPLGYGEKRLGTAISYGSNADAKPVAAYFRHTFNVDDAKKLGQLRFMIRSDDGFVAYINGKEVLRNNLPEGAVTFTTNAVKDLDGIAERLYHKFSADASALVTGKNVLAFEVHQSSPKSDDLCLDVAMRGYETGEDLRPVLSAEAKPVAEAFRYKHYIAAGVPIPDGFTDGGRRAKFDDDGHVSSGREVLIVDRAHDLELQKLLKFAKSDDVQKLSEGTQARKLAEKIKSLDDPEGEINWMEAMSGFNEYANERVLIGDVSKICGTGVCRHRSLLFKLMADEAGLSVAVVKGYLKMGRQLGAHEWNELHLKDGTMMVVDVAYSPHKPVFPETEATIYVTDDMKPMYFTPGSEKALKAEKEKAEKEKAETN